MFIVKYVFLVDQEGDDLFPFSRNGLDLEYSDQDYVDTWKAMEEVNKKGLAKSIGVSNFNKSQIERILENATVVPATNQVNLDFAIYLFNKQR